MLKLKSIPEKDVLFMDIETVPNWYKLEDAPENFKNDWIRKFESKMPAHVKNDSESYLNFINETWNSQASFFAEFSRIACISVGFIIDNEIRIKSYHAKNEKDLISDFYEDLTGFDKYVKGARPCAHFGKGFDFPFIAKRSIANGIEVHRMFDNYGLKPWDSFCLDTHEAWRNGWNSNGGSLSVLCSIFGIDSPKNKMSGSDVKDYYYNDRILEIVDYCESDVFALAKVFRAMKVQDYKSLKRQ